MRHKYIHERRTADSDVQYLKTERTQLSTHFQIKEWVGCARILGGRKKIFRCYSSRRDIIETFSYMKRIFLHRAVDGIDFM